MPPDAIHEDPLYAVLGTIAALWVMANVGYFAVLPVFGYHLSYNVDPFAIAGNFLFWSAASIIYFWSRFRSWLKAPEKIWLYVLVSAVCAAVIWALLYVISILPQLSGPAIVPYTDLLFATPWYFLPKSAEVLLQQILITILVLELNFRLHSLKRVVTAYAVCFGGAHVLLFALSGAPTPYALCMTLGAVASSLVFPYLLLRVEAGFVYAFAIHLLFYIALVLGLHALPPPGYFGV